MHEVARNKELLKMLLGDNGLLDSNLRKFCVYEENGNIKAEFIIDMRRGSSHNQLLLRFEGIKEVSFFYTEKHIFYNVERYKLFQTSNHEFYMSLDPENEDEIISEEDLDFVLAESVIGFAI